MFLVRCAKFVVSIEPCTKNRVIFTEKNTEFFLYELTNTPPQNPIQYGGAPPFHIPIPSGFHLCPRPQPKSGYAPDV